MIRLLSLTSFVRLILGKKTKIFSKTVTCRVNDIFGVRSGASVGLLGLQFQLQHINGLHVHEQKRN